MISLEVLIVLYEVVSIDERMQMETALGWPRKCRRLLLHPVDCIDLSAIKSKCRVHLWNQEQSITIELPIRENYPQKWYRIHLEESSDWVLSTTLKWKLEFRDIFDYHVELRTEMEFPEGILFNRLMASYMEWGLHPTFKEKMSFYDMDTQELNGLITYEIDKGDFSLKRMEIQFEKKEGKSSELQHNALVLFVLLLLFILPSSLFSK